MGGAREPLYQPGQAGGPAVIRYREDFAASALHEIAHWCLAGPQRRQRLDFGYRYQPPPRSSAEQERFLEYELRPQALESLFAERAGISFRPSFDDVEDRHLSLRPGFIRALQCERESLRDALPVRAARFAQALSWLQDADPCR